MQVYCVNGSPSLPVTIEYTIFIYKFDYSNPATFPTSQVKDDLGRFLESMMSKSGKLRSLIRELRSKYSSDSAATQPLILCSSG
jgi:hypothetical protein